jgi:uncharacterized OB-fold protein
MPRVPCPAPNCICSRKDNGGILGHLREKHDGCFLSDAKLAELNAKHCAACGYLQSRLRHDCTRCKKLQKLSF